MSNVLDDQRYSGSHVHVLETTGILNTNYPLCPTLSSNNVPLCAVPEI